MIDEILPNTVVVILPPKADFQALAQHLQLAGWVREPDRTNVNVGDPEPVFVSWSQPMSENEIDYTFVPEMGFRLLEIRGPEADDWRSSISSVMSTVSVQHALGFLRSPETDKKLLGLKIAAALREPVFTSEVVKLTKDGYPLVRERAREVCESALPATIQAPYDVHEAFDLMLDVHQRRQTLRWLLHDYKEANASIIAVLESALVDPDWEVRATAMLAAARYDLKQLSLHLKDCEMPRVSRLGPIKVDREILHAAKEAVLFQFVGKPLEEPATEASERQKTWYHLRRCIAGLPPLRKDHIWLFIHSLTEPLHTDALPPDPLPNGVQQIDDYYLLKGTDIRLCWVEPMVHLLGDEEEGMPSSNPIRQFQPQYGFFITEQLISENGSKGAPYLCTCQEAQQLCQALSERTGASLQLPTPDEWEVAARGTDGRRFPWGNGYEPTWQIASSPWGSLELFGICPQWLNTDTPMATGSAGVRPCAHRFSANADKRYGVRLLLPVSNS